MTSSFPHTPDLTCPSDSFGSTRNSAQPCTNLIYKLADNPIPININPNAPYCPNNFADALLARVTQPMKIGTPMYFYINPIDILGKYNGIIFDRIRLAGSTSATGNLHAALYKMTGSLGDASLYNANSKKIMEGAVSVVVSATTSKFIDIVFPNNHTLTTYDDQGKPNHYFIGIYAETPASLRMVISGNIPEPFVANHPLSGYIYYGKTSASLGEKMNIPISITSLNDQGFFPYYTLWKF